MPFVKMSEKYEEDKARINAVRNGDQRAFEEIVEKYRGMVAKVVIGMLGNRPDADDVGQETFIRFYRSLNQYKGEASLGTYLTRIAINLSLNALKKRKRHEMTELDEKHNPLWIHASSSQQSDNVEWVQKALAQLDEKYRVVVVLRLIEGYSTKETAQILRLPEGTVLSRLARAQVKLKSILEKLEDS